ncbi:putative alpha-ketoglutarate-dependent taurine dioxygenase [Eremomyces bilateralis CBS 781.70]|uniref:Alpha-ketoglutarate-dependent taurine dioxygenase n=1 Tax=Eremomyces bilateralis CBS 781.70 TaxID=1392243 RepID=A0A6G1GHZ7_9PEZI|nr:putative alpha-ketoglutarate-dependent taurine dioxygenase [Eremomyces bilateralis CBS 781.70]KAF1817576.1 putative alpha-ketoglutarate-dependent taurine dioxygenase [Eremomyces bilateralis CBS 781.70]
MSPSATVDAVPLTAPITKEVPSGPLKEKAPAVQPKDDGLPKSQTGHKEPLQLSGALDQFEQFDVTTVIGKEFANVDLAEWLHAPNSDELLRDLAITVSQRGVVFFRKQDNIDNALQKELVQRLGELTGKPATLGLHNHPFTHFSHPARGDDDKISTISSVQVKTLYPDRFAKLPQSKKRLWHSDITFEPVPSDYALLRLTELPKTGGDTLWAWGYELYDRISKPLRSSSTSSRSTPPSRSRVRCTRERRGSPRGHPPRHPHQPVTGWRSAFAVGNHVQSIPGLSEAESKHFLDWFLQLIVENHDLQVRLRWQNPNDVAIWGNRSVFHIATPDFIKKGLGERTRSRAVSLGERPYFDSQSTGRQEALAAAKGLDWGTRWALGGMASYSGESAAR